MAERHADEEDRQPDDDDRDKALPPDDGEEPKLTPPDIRVPEGPDNLRRRRDWFQRRSGADR